MDFGEFLDKGIGQLLGGGVTVKVDHSISQQDRQQLDDLKRIVTYSLIAAVALAAVTVLRR